MENQDHHKQHHNKNGKGKNSSKEEAKNEKNQLKDHLAEKTKHGHEAAMEHSDHNNHDHDDMDHSDHHRMMIEDFKRRFWISLVLTIPILALSPMIQGVLGVEWVFPGSGYVLFGLSTIVYFYGGWPFLAGLVDEIKSRAIGMMTLIAVAITAAYVYSSAVIFGFEGQTFFWELATLIVVMLIGHWLEMRSILGASKALEALAALMPDEANLVDGNQTKKVQISELKEGDIILIRPGEKVPADGIIVEGESDLNESMLTGESRPVTKTVDDEVIGGAINGNGVVKVKVKGIGEGAYLSKVIHMVQEAQKQKSKSQRLADVAAKWLTIIAFVVGFGTFFTWLALGETMAFAMERMVTVMVISCPHALGLAVPLVAAISTSISARNGLLIRNRTAFESSRKITTIVFDKTGTLTKGTHEVTRIVSLSSDYDEMELLKYATAVESPSEHHISKGLMRKAKEEKLDIPAVTDFKYTAGVGVSGIVNGKNVQVGGFLLLEQLNKTVDEDKEEGIETKVFTIIDGELIGFITFADEIRESSYGAIETLHKNNIKVSLLTGDNEIVAKDVADKLGLDNYMAEVLPDQKLDEIKKLQQKGEFVAMVGDGVNDAPALAQANVGIAIGSGTDVAAETADIVLMDSNPRDIVNLILFGKATYRKMLQNLGWATGYNVVAIPLATGFIPGLMISPAVGAALMSASTIIAAANAQLLKGSMKSETEN